MFGQLIELKERRRAVVQARLAAALSHQRHRAYWQRFDDEAAQHRGRLERLQRQALVIVAANQGLTQVVGTPPPPLPKACDWGSRGFNFWGRGGGQGNISLINCLPPGRQSFFTIIVGFNAMLYGQRRHTHHGTCHMQDSATRTVLTGAAIFLFYQR